MAIYKASNGETYEITKTHSKAVYEEEHNNFEKVIKIHTTQTGWAVRNCNENSCKEYSIQDYPTVEKLYEKLELSEEVVQE